MNRIYCFIILLLCVNFSFAQENYNKYDEQGRKTGIWKKYQDNGKLLYEGTFMNDKPVGEFKRYHPNGMLKAHLKHDVYSDTAKAELFDNRARLIAEGVYVGQTKVGKWNYFDEGKLVSEETYKHGLKDGICKTYYQTGELFEESSWKNNLQEGTYRAYFKSGKPYLTCQMKMGQRNGTFQTYRENGQLELDAFYKNDLAQDEWIYYDESGNPSYTLIYDLGKLTNPEVLDSVQQVRINEMESGKENVLDPEQFVNDPMEYMIKNKILGR